MLLQLFNIEQFQVKVRSCLLQPNIVGETERASAGVTCGQFGTVRLKFKLSTYIQETVGDK